MYRDDAPHTHDCPGLIFTTARVVRNGIRSYVVETTTKYPEEASCCPDAYAYSLCHIEAIILRGRGPLIIEQPHEQESIERLFEDHRDDQCQYNRSRGGLKSSRSHYQWVFTEMLMYHLKAKFLPDAHHCFDLERAQRELMRQSFVTQYAFGHGRLTRSLGLDRETQRSLRTWTAPKKRVDAWFVANRNRFLTNLHRAADAYDREISRMLDAGMDLYDRNSGDDDGDDWRDDPGPRAPAPLPPDPSADHQPDPDCFELEAELY